MDRRTFLKTVPGLTVVAAGGRGFAQNVVQTPKTAGAPAASPAPAPPPTPAPVPAAAPGAAIVLPKPEMDGGKSVLAAIRERKTTREISRKPLPPQVLSNLLWAAWGINRENGPMGKPGRTAASARNSQEIDLYVLLPEGTYIYEAIPHRLVPVAAGDVRSKIGGGHGDIAREAPVQLIYVADTARYPQSEDSGMKDPQRQQAFYNVAAGLIGGNVYLFAASQGLAAWLHACDQEGLATELKLRPEQRVVYVHTVGYPA
ncbi:MAG TPA: nitroreductase family protein [Phycisphaerae bacterium]|nr:nitroreductase family protein [Phycisphaerae bacterium]HRS27342.1 nitroreductase family protein [Phycisphaerae bacterium]HRT41468.1 nitroreductase family protein [Phycisphaerae bacterium]